MKKTVGKQILGYTVDLAKRSPEAVVEWLKASESPKTEEGSSIETPEAASKYVAPAATDDKNTSSEEEKK